MAAGDALGTQFWKANPNQMAFPGMEENSHPGAPLLAQGYHFNHYLDSVGSMTLTASKGEQPSDAALKWNIGAHPRLNMGEIANVATDPAVRGRGIATALYGVGRQMARIKPQHSATRTFDGDAFAAKSAAKYGGRVPKSDNWS